VLRLGMLAGDSGHTVEFTRRLNHVRIDQDQWVDGARVVAAVPTTSQIDPQNIPGYLAELRACGVPFFDRIEDLVGRVDAVLIETQDGCDHLAQVLPFIEAGLPTFVDKPLATTTADARRMLEAAQKRGVAFGSASALRYALELQDVHLRGDALGAVLGVDAYSPALVHPRNPGLFHYGVHGVEPLFALMGTGCRSVRSVSDEGTEVAVGRWADGRLGTVRGMRRGAFAFGFTAFCANGVESRQIDGRFFYRELLKVLVNRFTQSRWLLKPEEMIEPIAFMEAALASSRRGGDEVALSTA
jgi:virulence factor